MSIQSPMCSKLGILKCDRIMGVYISLATRRWDPVGRGGHGGMTQKGFSSSLLISFCFLPPMLWAVSSPPGLFVMLSCLGATNDGLKSWQILSQNKPLFLSFVDVRYYVSVMRKQRRHWVPAILKVFCPNIPLEPLTEGMTFIVIFHFVCKLLEADGSPHVVGGACHLMLNTSIWLWCSDLGRSCHLLSEICVYALCLEFKVELALYTSYPHLPDLDHLYLRYVQEFVSTYYKFSFFVK